MPYTNKPLSIVLFLTSCAQIMLFSPFWLFVTLILIIGGQAKQNFPAAKFPYISRQGNVTSSGAKPLPPPKKKGYGRENSAALQLKVYLLPQQVVNV
jgi:hypothetical protein